MANLDQYLQTNRAAFEDQLCELLRIPSVSTDGQFAGEVAKAGQWVADQFLSMGLKTELIETDRHPIIYAESPPVEGAPTALVYGHYDVQPPDPLDEWVSPPFEPTRRDGNIYARGATDDKGQMLTHVFAAKALIETDGKLPLQLKFVIEGEEECGSESFYPFLESSKDRLDCDVIVISDTSQFAAGQPAITYGLRGIAYFELRLEGPKQDLHSGTFGGAVSNPANALAKMLAGLVDDEGRVLIPGFYDDVEPLRPQEREQFAALPFDDQAFMDQVGVKGLHGEQGYSTLERRWVRPTYDVNGIWGGYQGAGGKTVLPAKAAAKFSFRLVPNQDPEKIAASLTSYLATLKPAGIEMELIDMHHGPGFLASLDSPFMAAAADAIEAGFGQRPVFIREGGSIPVVTEMSRHLNADSLLLGWGLDDDNTHSPNEKFSLGDFHRGIKSSACLWREMSRIKLA
jgi:succinyl-diaminopimelate desuccinylase